MKNLTKRPMIALLTASLLIVLAVGGWIFMKQPGDVPTATSTADAPSSRLPEGEVVAEVVMGADGYEPSTVTLKAGQAIRFVNSSDGKRWPASNIHPTHDIYPEFDPKKELGPGETWTFTFRQKGSWRMHDHLFPYMKGLITVD